MKFELVEIKKMDSYETNNEIVYDLQVDDNHSFCVNDCIVVHNSVCSTKSVTGIYYPQFSAIQDSYLACSELGGIICSDGGIKEVGDICKAMGIGANLVMCGSLFSGYNESETEWHIDDSGREYMLFYGMSSSYANNKYNKGLKSYRAAEGTEIRVIKKSDISSLLQEIKGGLASCCSYTNFKNLQDSVGKQNFIQI